MIKVGIGFVTGRRNFTKVLKTYINNWLEHGLISNEKIRFHLFVAYDLKYQNTEIKDYKNIDPLVLKMIESVTFIGEKKISNESNILVEQEILTEKEAKLIFGEGYAKKRNAVMYHAIKHKMDKLIFLDDDEYPMAVSKHENGTISWMGQSIAGTHLRYNNDADITHGHHCGYISPIPTIQFNNVLTEGDFKLFIETISNDIISWEKVKKTIIQNNGITYAKKEIIYNDEATEVKEKHGMKFISGANICFNLQKCKKSIPPFFTPPGARGEDTFMSTCLTNLKVVKVPCYAFHDGFSTYNNLLNGVLPVSFLPVNSKSPVVVNRFIKATIGWIRYKPLLILITQREKFEYTIQQMKLKLHATIPLLCKYFNTEKFKEIETELNRYVNNVEKHYALFESTKTAWKKILKSIT